MFDQLTNFFDFSDLPHRPHERMLEAGVSSIKLSNYDRRWRFEKLFFTGSRYWPTWVPAETRSYCCAG